MHECGYIHAKLSPERLIIGKVPDDTILYLVSFDKTLIKDSAYNRCTATPSVNYEFMSLSAHKRGIISWKDDLESLCYILIYFLKGKLPWSDQVSTIISSHNGIGLADAINQTVYRSKLEYSIEDICKNLPGELIRRNPRTFKLL